MEGVVQVENNSSPMSPEKTNSTILTHIEDTPPLPTKKLSFGDAESVRRSSVLEPENKLHVYLRIKPRIPKADDTEVKPKQPFDVEPGDTLVSVDKTTVQVQVPPESRSSRHRNIVDRYSFREVFTKSSEQQEVFQATTKPLIRTLFHGKDCLLFAYGVTNAGKTYTMEGTSEKPGIIPRTLDEVFKKVKEEESSKYSYQVSASYLQVYNERVQDLQYVDEGNDATISNNQRPHLRILHSQQNVEVEGLIITPIESSADGLEILENGKRMRTTHGTSLNTSSSRSHAVFTIYLSCTDNETNKTTSSRLYLVDLAGTERKKRTQTTYARHHEATKINVSLMFLMKCFNEIRVNQRQARLYPKRKPNVIPFRQSELTKLFRGCLCGPKSGLIGMIVNASAEPQDFDETVKALNYGELARSVNVGRPPVPQAPGPGRPTVQYDMHGRRVYTTVPDKQRCDSATESKANEGDEASLEAELLQDGGESTSSTGTLKRNSAKIPTRLSLEMAEVAEMAENLRRRSSGQHRASTDTDEGMYLDESFGEDTLRLQRELAEALAKNLELEASIREEVSLEMSSRLQEMESTFRKRLDYVKNMIETSAQHTIQSLKKQLELQNEEVSEYINANEIRQQVLECEAEMQRMQEIHKFELESLRNEIAAMRATSQENEDDESSSDDDEVGDENTIQNPQSDGMQLEEQSGEEQKDGTPTVPRASIEGIPTPKRKSSAGTNDSEEANKRIRELLKYEREAHQRTTIELQDMRTKWHRQTQVTSQLQNDVDKQTQLVQTLSAHVPAKVLAELKILSSVGGASVNVNVSPETASRAAKRKSGNNFVSTEQLSQEVDKNTSDNHAQDLDQDMPRPDSLKVPPMFVRTKEYNTIADLWKASPQEPSSSSSKKVRNSTLTCPTPEKLQTSSKEQMLKLQREREAASRSSKVLAAKVAARLSGEGEGPVEDSAEPPPVPARTFISKQKDSVTSSTASSAAKRREKVTAGDQNSPAGANTPGRGVHPLVSKGETSAGSTRSMLGWVRGALSSQKKAKVGRSILSPGRGIGFFKGAIGNAQAAADGEKSRKKGPQNRVLKESQETTASPMVPVARRTRSARMKQ